MKNTIPVFTKKGNMIPVTIAAANTASDGSGTLVTLVTAGADGTRVDGLKVTNGQVTPAASSAMVVRAFLTDAAGANAKLVGEIALPAATRTASVIGSTNTLIFSPALILEPGQLLRVAQSVYAGAQDTNSVIAYAGDY